MPSRNYCLLFAFVCLFLVTGANAALDSTVLQEEELDEDPLQDLLSKTTNPPKYPLGDVRVADEPPGTTPPLTPPSVPIIPDKK
jgi:hypothetical protein